MNTTKALTPVALFLATYLSIALAHLGLDKFYYVLAGGKKFATFPDYPTQFSIGGSYFLLSIIYLIWLAGVLRSSGLHSAWRFRDILTRTSVFWILAFISYPLGNDVYLYLHAGLMNLQNANPFLIRAAAFTTELSPYVDWGQTSTYGPVSQLLFTISAAFVAASPVVAVYVFKLFCLLLHLLNGYLIWRWLPLQERGKITIAYILHPLLLMEQVGSAHVDILVSTSVILFALGMAKQRYWLAFASLWGGFLAKTLPIIWAPLVVVSLLRQRQWKRLLGMVAASGAIVAVLSVTFLPGLAAWQSLLNPGVAGQHQSSLISLARYSLDFAAAFLPSVQLLPKQQQEVLQWLSRVTLVGFAGFYAWRLWRSDQRSNHPLQILLEDMGWVTLILMVFATAWVMPWYASILITFAALLPEARLFGATSLAFGLSSSAQYLFLSNASFKSLISVGLPILVLVVGRWLIKPRFAQCTTGKEPSDSSHESSTIDSVEMLKPQDLQNQEN